MTIETPFASLGLAEPILRAIADAGYTTPTPIQAQAIPQVLAGGDLLAAAQTGTGKTAGFTLPILHLLASRAAQAKPGRPRCLILVPTRELAARIPDALIDEVGIVGNAADCRAQLAAFRAAGVGLPVLAVSPVNEARDAATRRALQALAPR